jgi:signal peptidase I
VTDAREASIGPAGLDKAPPLVPEFRATVDTRLRSPEKPENAGAPAGDSKSRSAKDRSKRRRFIEWVVVIVLAVLVAAGLRTFVTIHRGDIVVFKRPPRDVGTADKDLVKRVIGLPGETISSRASTVLINGKPLGEPWLPALTGSCAENAENIPRTKIPPGQYFVMGDCRGNSADSRTWGTLPGSLIVGRVFVSVWRFGHPYFHWF